MAAPSAQLQEKREEITVQGMREWLSEEVYIDLVQIPAGEFLMGSPETEEGRDQDEGPQHHVKVPAFLMGRYPVTQQQWRFVANLDQFERELNPDPAHFKGDKLPVESVSCYEAVEFCERLSRFTNRDYRLPTEAEWEYACRAGTITPFHFGETLSAKYTNYVATETYGSGEKGEYREKTTPVDQFGAVNPFGLADMHGNVLEWCQDLWHDSYDDAPTNGSGWINGGDSEQRVARGGSWSSNPEYCRSAYRRHLSSDGKSLYIGFRLIYVPR